MVSSGYRRVGPGAMLESCFTLTSLRGIPLLYAEVTVIAKDHKLLYYVSSTQSKAFLLSPTLF